MRPYRTEINKDSKKEIYLVGKPYFKELATKPKKGDLDKPYAVFVIVNNSGKVDKVIHQAYFDNYSDAEDDFVSEAKKIDKHTVKQIIGKHSLIDGRLFHTKEIYNMKLKNMKLKNMKLKNMKPIGEYKTIEGGELKW
jgi:hypothetical protein